MSGSPVVQNGKVVGIVSFKVGDKTYSPIINKSVISALIL